MKINIITCLFVVLSLPILSQEVPSHEKKIYVSPEGKMYINKDLPVYLRIATSPDENAQSFLLKSEQSAKYSNPFYFDTEGMNTVRTPSCVDTVTRQTVYPLQDIIFEVYTDSRAPVTKVNYGKTKTYKKEGKIFVSGELELELIAHDELSGIENIYFSIDEQGFKPYSQVLGFSQEKEYTLKYYAVDHVGNTETLNTLILVIDRSKPVTSYEVQGDFHENVLSARSKIILKTEDKTGVGTESIFYKIDDGVEKKYTSPILGTYLNQGEHTLTFYSKDHVLNMEDVKTYSFYVDKTPPVIVQEILGKSFFAGGKEYSSGRSQLKFTTFDNKAGVKRCIIR
ncbi:MAG: hypothetical protein HC906_10380 [Bacteroidales bacterium]|nr:hypothetical protein [Bacteroidales bacterium]